MRVTSGSKTRKLAAALAPRCRCVSALAAAALVAALAALARRPELAALVQERARERRERELWQARAPALW